MSLNIEINDSLKIEQQTLIEKIIVESKSRIKELLPLENVLIKVHIDEKQAIPQYGVGGWCFNADGIEIALCPDREKDWTDHLPRAVAHEWHHLARLRGIGYGSTLVDIIISEGLAQHFEIECFSGKPSFYSTILTTDQRQNAISTFFKEVSKSDYDHARWFFGAGELPFLAGYDVSYHLLERYMKSVNSISSKEVDLRALSLIEKLESLKTNTTI